MIAVDTNILVYAAIDSGRHHAAARALVTELAEGSLPWAIPWPCVYEFFRVVTHARFSQPPVPLAIARANIAALMQSPLLSLLSETSRHEKVLEAVLDESPVTGNLLFDAHIVALCREHGVSELLSTDGDFTRFRGPKVTHPFRAD